MILAAALFALAIGPEVPLSAPAIDAAAGDQTKPSLAWYGDSLAAAWIDQRDAGFGVRIAQLDALGHPKGIATRVYGSVNDVRLAANGAATPLIATQYAGPTYIGPAGTSGRGVGGALGDLVTDGSTYLLVTHEKTIHAEVLDSLGEMNAIAEFGHETSDVVAVPIGGAYHVIYQQTDCFVGCAISLYDTIVQTDGTISTQLIANGLPASTSIAAAAAGDRLLIAWSAASRIELFTLTPSRTLVTHTSIPASGNVFAGSDGNEFLVAWHDGKSLQATRINLDGFTTGERFTLGTEHTFDLTFARTPLGVVLAWSDGLHRDIFTRGATGFAGIASAPTTLASLGYIQQEDLSLKGVPVWSEGENHSRIVSTSGVIAEAANVELRHPVAARGAGSTLVAWRQDEASGASRVMARFNDQPAVALGAGLAAVDLDVVFDGSSFFVFWATGNLYRTRFTTGGTQLETTTIASSGKIHSLTAGRAGDKAVVAWVDGTTVTYEGRPVANASFPTKPQLAFDDRDQPFLVWGDRNCTMTAHRVDDALFAAQSLFCNTRTQPVSTAIAWSGTEFVIAWSDSLERGFHNRTVRYMRTQRNGAPLDAQPIGVDPSSDIFAPSLVSSPAGVTFGYTRSATEEPFDVVSRVFTRTIERLGTTPRERAIGR